MPSIYKRPGSSNWQAEYTLHTGARAVKTTGTASKKLAERIARGWEESELELRTGLRDARLESIARHEAAPIETHITALGEFRRAKGSGRKAVAKTLAQIRAVVAIAQAQRIGDLTAESVMDAIATLRAPASAGGRDLSNETASEYIRNLKGFYRWAVRNRRAAVDQLAGLEGFNAEEDRRLVRRDLSREESLRVIRAAHASPTVTIPKRYRTAKGEPVTTGTRTLHLRDRGWAYEIAEGTGFRLSEVSSLTPESFHLGPGSTHDVPTITVEAAYSKRRKRDTQPIDRALAARLRPWLATKAAGTPVCPLPGTLGAAVLRADLAAARAAWVNEATTPAQRERRAQDDGFLLPIDGAGRVADFHALRHTYITRVVNDSGATVREAQELARHSDPRLTMRRYAHVQLKNLSSVVNRLAGGAEAQRRSREGGQATRAGA